MAVAAVAKSRIRVGDVCVTAVVADTSLRRDFGDDGPSVDRNGFVQTVAVILDLELDPIASVSEAVVEGDGTLGFEIEILTGVVSSKETWMAELASAPSSL